MTTFAASFGLDPLSWTVYPTLDIGPLSISPHGIGIAVGFLLGAQLMVRRSRRFDGPAENDIWNTLFYALIGAIVGARAGYVFGHFSEVTDGGDDLLGILRIWEGGISLIGGITGAVLFALPYMLRKKMGFWRTMDLAAPGLALGIIIGRIGDLVIGDHLGEPTNFALGWLCAGESGSNPVDADVYLQALAEGRPPSLGCYDLLLHQTALYDLFSTILLLGLLLWVGRKVRPTGLMILTFTVWYSAMRVVTDFLRVDKRYFGLTGSQLMSITVGVICLYLLARYRGAPKRFQRPPDGGPEGARDRSTPPPPPPPALVGAKTTSDSVTESDEKPL
jgi:phosphatidylglycerol:prolipoprotein diacylglycerol transferase